MFTNYFFHNYVALIMSQRNVPTVNTYNNELQSAMGMITQYFNGNNFCSNMQSILCVDPYVYISPVYYNFDSGNVKPMQQISNKYTHSTCICHTILITHLCFLAKNPLLLSYAILCIRMCNAIIIMISPFNHIYQFNQHINNNKPYL